MENINFDFANSHEMSKADFEQQKNFNHWNVFSQKQILEQGSKVLEILKKGEVNELSSEDQESLKIMRAELKDVTPIRVVDMVEGRIIKGLVYVQDPQVKVIDTLEKSTDGQPIQKGIFLDTPLNRELGRVGKTFFKGKACDATVKNEMMKAIREKEEYKAAHEMFEKGGADSEILDNLKKAYPTMSDQDYKNFKKAYAHGKIEKAMNKAEKYKKELNQLEQPENTEE